MENQPIGYRFIGIEIISRSMTTQPPQGVSGQFNFDIRLEMRVQADISAVIPFVHVDVKDEQAPVASMVVACIFEIEKFKEHIRQNEQGQFEVPQALQSFLAPIS